MKAAVNAQLCYCAQAGGSKLVADHTDRSGGQHARHDGPIPNLEGRVPRSKASVAAQNASHQACSSRWLHSPAPLAQVRSWAGMSAAQAPGGAATQHQGWVCSSRPAPPAVGCRPSQPQMHGKRHSPLHHSVSCSHPSWPTCITPLLALALHSKRFQQAAAGLPLRQQRVMCSVPLRLPGAFPFQRSSQPGPRTGATRWTWWASCSSGSSTRRPTWTV